MRPGANEVGNIMIKMWYSGDGIVSDDEKSRAY